MRLPVQMQVPPAAFQSSHPPTMTSDPFGPNLAWDSPAPIENKAASTHAGWETFN